MSSLVTRQCLYAMEHRRVLVDVRWLQSRLLKVSLLGLVSNGSRVVGTYFFFHLVVLLSCVCSIRKEVLALPLELRLDDFVQFLVDHACDVVGFSGLSFFHNPLAEWLTVSCGCLVSVDTDQYGRVSSGRCYPLPCWARRLVSWLDTCTHGVPLTGEMVFSALSLIEVGAPLPRL